MKKALKHADERQPQLLYALQWADGRTLL